ncbi:glucosaminidase domain-containing protein [Thalassotalea maritima]|uniref:glucosaminidase domain-containing protein n=1 Tax=Thalassotalea maritima TaxID=3242416 RepID=UPI003528B39F
MKQVLSSDKNINVNRRRHKTIKGVLLLMVFVMMMAPFIFYQSQEVDIEVSEAQIVDKIPKQERPLHSVDIPDFMAIADINQRKQAFFNFLKPAIDAENQRLATIRNRLLSIQSEYQQQRALDTVQVEWLNNLAKQYKLDDANAIDVSIAKLLLRVDEIPRELVLVQAANESAWGSSRFARIGLNFFGIWCFKKGCGLVPKGRESGLQHEVASFSSVEQMIRHYFHNLNTNGAYNMLRKIRAQLRQHNLPLRPSVLATGLLPYSERGIDYVVEINTMLRHNEKYIKS